MISATGFLPTTSANDFSCMSSGGWRVSIEAMSPRADAFVSVTRCAGGRSPTSGMRSSALVTTLTWPGAATVFAPSLVTARIEYLPGFLNGTWAA